MKDITKCCLLIDFGSTYTKLTLIDLDNESLLDCSMDYTTVNTNIKYGYYNALEKLKEKIDFSRIQITDKYACSSAAGGLKMIAIGTTPDFTSEAAKRSALGAGARLLKVYSYLLSEKSLEEIESLHPNIILLTGGAENGNTSYIINNAVRLSELSIKIPIVVAGNSQAIKDIESIFKKSESEFYITENVMPDINSINPKPAREVIRKIFMKQIVKAKGMSEISEITESLLMPTPTAVLKAAELLSFGTKKTPGLGDVMVLDIGGATTDVHTISNPVYEKNMLVEGMEEPVIKITVEGDLGMRYSAVSLFEAVGEEGFKKYDNNVSDVHEKCLERQKNPFMISENEEELRFDEIMAKNCVRISVLRHGGKLRATYINGRDVLVQSGKDLRKIKVVIGTGGIILNSRNPDDILEVAKEPRKNRLLPENPEFYIDKKYIMSAMGVLSMINEELALKLLIDNINKNN